MFTLKVRTNSWDIPVKEFNTEQEAIEYVKMLDLFEYSYKIFDENSNLVLEHSVNKRQSILTRYEYVKQNRSE